MAFTGSYYCTSYLVGLHNGVFDFSVDTFRVALYTSSASMNAATTAYSATNEVAGAGYTAGGAAVVPTITEISTANGTVVCTTYTNPSWTGATITARGALLYDDTAAGNPAIAVLDFGMDITVTAGTFPFQFPAATANTGFEVMQTVLNN